MDARDAPTRDESDFYLEFQKNTLDYKLSDRAKFLYIHIIETYVSLTNNIAPILAKRIGNWGVIALGLFLSTVAMVSLPFCKDQGLTEMYKLFGPCFVLGIGVALVDVGVLSTMGILVDTRHTPVYGTVFAISDIALCLAFALGPLSGGAIVEAIRKKAPLIG